jgi:Amt family ammonium transporter
MIGKRIALALLPTVALAGEASPAELAQLSEEIESLRAQLKDVQGLQRRLSSGSASDLIGNSAYLECTDSNDGATDKNGNTCLSYNETMCESAADDYDDDDFTAGEMCCACGAGSRKVDDLGAQLAYAMDSAWLIICGALVFFMHAGFAMLESGSCRAKNASNVLMKNLVNVCVSTIAWYAFGWAFAYGGPYDDDGLLQNGGFMGTKQFFAGGFFTTDDDGIIMNPDGTADAPFAGTYNVPLGWFFQWAFCATCATIVSGAVAERVLSPTYAAYAFIMAAFIYPVVVAWTWGYGWLVDLFDVGYMDFAGSGIVHLCGGASGLAGTLVLGPRKGRFERPDEFQAHNLPLTVLGTCILWFGWYGFNCGSTLGMSDASTGALAATVAMNTTIAAAVGGITVFFLRYGISHQYDVGGLCNGILAGLVSITAPCGNVEAGSAFAIGFIGAVIYQGSSMLLVKLKIDDPVDAVPVHGFCGIWGVLAAALFDWGNGLDHFHGWSGFSCMTDDTGDCQEGIWGKVFGVQCIMVIVICLWSGILSGITFFLLKLTGYLRIDEATEEIGIDAAKHSPSKAYSINSPSRAAEVEVDKHSPAKAYVPEAI